MPRRERNIFLRRDGRYEARYRKGSDENGKTVYGSVYSRNYADVREKRNAKVEQLQQARRTVLLPEFAQPSHQTVVDVLQQYLASIRNKVKASTFGVYQRYLDCYISPFFKDMPSNRLAYESIQSFVDKQFESGLSSTTIKAVYCLLKKGLKPVCKCENTFTVKFPRALSPEADVLSVEEQKRLENAARTSDNVNCIGVILCLYTGIRVGELCGLFWQDVDFKRRVLHVRRTVQRINCESEDGKKTVVISTVPKSGASQRSIPLPDFLAAFLEKHYRTSTSKYVIASPDGKSLEPRNMQHRFKRLLVLAGVRDIKFHTTRHCFATRALELGFDMKTLSEILGHASVAVTMRKYAHTQDSHKRKSMEALEGLFL